MYLHGSSCCIAAGRNGFISCNCIIQNVLHYSQFLGGLVLVITTVRFFSEALCKWWGSFESSCSLGSTLLLSGGDFLTSMISGSVNCPIQINVLLVMRFCFIYTSSHFLQLSFVCNVEIDLGAGWFGVTQKYILTARLQRWRWSCSWRPCSTAHFRRLTNLTHIIQATKHKWVQFISQVWSAALHREQQQKCAQGLLGAALW